MSYTIRLSFEEKVSQLEIERAMTIDQILEIWDPEKEKAIVGAILDHQVVHLNTRIDRDVELKLLDVRTRNGQLIYERTLSFVFTTACYNLFPTHPVRIEHSLNNGLYAEFNAELAIDQGRVDLIKAEMNRLIQEDLPIRRLRISMEQMKEIYEKQQREFRLDLNRDLDLQEVTISELDEYYDKFYGYLATRTGVIEKFDLTFHRPGMILVYPRSEHNFELPPNVRHEKIAAIFQESERWAKILEISDVFSLNRQIDKQRIDEIIRISEALHEKKIAQIADDICNHPKKRVILIAGPSASGKTTFSKRLFIQLRVNERRPLTISLDNYFVDREKTPRDSDGKYNFEALEAIDIATFNRDLRRLLDGEAVVLPVFDFVEGKRKTGTEATVLEAGQPVVIEGIHGLNDALTPEIAASSKYKIYVSALTQLNIDSHNRIKTTDNRLMRRMVRDVQFRGASVEQTLGMWPSVRRGEQNYIFPFQEEADAVFNSALVYEFIFLKNLLDPQLEKIGPDSVHYAEVKRLRKILYYFQTYTRETAIPNTSILKEFLGGSCFES